MNTCYLQFRFDKPAFTHRFARHAASLVLLVAVLALAACAGTSPTYHRYVMQGQVLDLDGDSAVVCIGDRHGARVGQELAVIRHVRKTGGPPKGSASGFRREPVGMVRIAEVFDEHYARAEVVSGRLQVNDVVELARR